MDQIIVQSKWAQAETLTTSVPEHGKSEARIAVMTALLLRESAPGAVPATVMPAEARPSSPKITSIRQLSRITRKKGVSRHEVVVLLAWFLKETQARNITAKDCRENWSVLADCSFKTTCLHRADESGWLTSVEQDGQQSWELTSKGYDVCMRLQTDTVDGSVS